MNKINKSTKDVIITLVLTGAVGGVLSLLYLVNLYTSNIVMFEL
jgi:hypothetical protein